MITVDIRRGLTPMDETMLNWVEPLGVPVALLLTKADKLSRGAGLAQQQAVARQVASNVRQVRFSAIGREGVAEAKAWLEAWLRPGALEVSAI